MITCTHNLALMLSNSYTLKHILHIHKKELIMRFTRWPHSQINTLQFLIACSMQNGGFVQAIKNWRV